MFQGIAAKSSRNLLIVFIHFNYIMPKLVSKTAATSARHQRTRIKRSLVNKKISVRNIKAHVRAKKRLLNQVKLGFIEKDVVR